MQFTADTRNATAFELNALAEFIAKLASVAPGQEGRPVAQSTAVLQAVMPELPELPVGNEPPAPAAGAAEATPTAGPAAPAVPPAPGAIPPAPAAAPESTTPTAVPAAPTPAPVTTASPVAAAPSATELDSAGFPWDARIHAATQTTIGDGTWRKKPGVAPELVAQVQAEFLGNAPVASATAQAGSTGTQTSEPAPIVPPCAPAPEAPPAPAAVLLTGQDVMQRCTEIQMANPSAGAQLFQALVNCGVQGGPMGIFQVTDQGVLAKALEAVNAVAGAA